MFAVPEFNVEHIALARWADVVIAPATADLLARSPSALPMTCHGRRRSKHDGTVLIVPAMNTNMYLNPITQDNMAKLKKFTRSHRSRQRVICLRHRRRRPPGTEPAPPHDYIELLACRNDLLKGKKVIVTAGGTREPIDGRFIGNHSSGHWALPSPGLPSRRCAVTSSPTTDTPPQTPVGLARRIDVGSTRDMKAAVDSYYDDCDLVIKAAAVADYRSAHPAENKIKKNDDTDSSKWPESRYHLYGLGQRKTHQTLVGFAAETTNVIEYGTKKLKKKNLDMLVANDVSAEGAGFKGTTNIATLLFLDGSMEKLEKMDKDELAAIIVARAAAIMAKKKKLISRSLQKRTVACATVLFSSQQLTVSSYQRI